MYDYEFRFADKESFDVFNSIVYDEELWSLADENKLVVVVNSIFENTAAYLYELIEERGLRLLN